MIIEMDCEDDDEDNDGDGNGGDDGDVEFYPFDMVGVLVSLASFS